ncbi:MAG: tetraacyldisaccharide 4'-kinase [Mariprofundaceae bacterium]|nr:tetraacyldisaccharide 4'-kinase [Mariprofundaceae bacterium]
MKNIYKLKQWVENYWWKSEKPCLMLRSLSGFYHYLNQYNLKKRFDRREIPLVPLISVGNITVGGSGKTPFVVWLVKELQGRGFSPVVLCRGDGGSSQKLRWVEQGDNASDVGDEAKMLFEQCACPVIRGRDRLQAAGMAAVHGDVLILDDGFQYRQLQATLDIVLVPHVGVGNACMLPVGPMREPVSALQRADMVVRTGGKKAKQLSAQKEWWWWAKPNLLKDINTAQQVPPKEMLALTSIARPQRFVDALRSKYIQVRQHIFFPDHHVFCQDDIADALSADFAIAVTAKDAVKLLALWPLEKPLWVLGQEPNCEQGLMEEIHGHMLRHQMENHHVG